MKRVSALLLHILLQSPIRLLAAGCAETQKRPDIPDVWQVTPLGLEPRTIGLKVGFAIATLPT
jgi:hypothetical protein